MDGEENVQDFVESDDGGAEIHLNDLGRPVVLIDISLSGISILPPGSGPAYHGSHVTLAGVLAQLGRPAEAAAERKKAAELTRVAVNRQRATFAANTGSVLLLKNQITDAIERYQEAVSSDPTYVEAHRGLATALERAGRTAEAEAERQKAAQLEQARP